MINIWRDLLSGTLHIKIEIDNVFIADNVFLLQDVEKILFDVNKPIWERLGAITLLAKGIYDRH